MLSFLSLGMMTVDSQSRDVQESRSGWKNWFSSALLPLQLVHLVTLGDLLECLVDVVTVQLELDLPRGVVYRHGHSVFLGL